VVRNFALESCNNVWNIKERYEFEFTDEIFTFSSILDPSYGFAWIPKSGRSFRDDMLKIFVSEIYEKEIVSSLVTRSKSKSL
jgi:hypothetical protein